MKASYDSIASVSARRSQYCEPQVLKIMNICPRKVFGLRALGDWLQQFNQNHSRYGRFLLSTLQTKATNQNWCCLIRCCSFQPSLPKKTESSFQFI